MSTKQTTLRPIGKLLKLKGNITHRKHLALLFLRNSGGQRTRNSPWKVLKGKIDLEPGF